MVDRALQLVVLLCVCTNNLGCQQRAALPEDPDALAAVAVQISETLQPGLTLRRDRYSNIFDELELHGAYGAEVLPDSSAVVIRMNGFPRNYRYHYRLSGSENTWTHRTRVLKLQHLGGPWYWRVCRTGVRSGYPC